MNDQSAKEDVYFGPKNKGEVFLSVVCVLSAGGLIYLQLFEFGVRLPPDPRYRGTLIMGLLVFLLLVGARAALRWRPDQSELRVNRDGIEMRSWARHPLRRTQLPWESIARFEHRKSVVFRGADMLWLVVFEPEHETGRAQEH